jgi:hypothetical protein
VEALTDTHALLGHGEAVEVTTLSSDLVADTPVPVAWSQLASAPGRSVDAIDSWSIDHRYAYHLRAYVDGENVDLATDIDPAGLDGGAGPVAFRVPGELLFHGLTDAGLLEYVYRDASSLRRCVRDLTAGRSTCAKLRGVSRGASRVNAQRQAQTLVLTIGDEVYSCAGSATCRPARVRLPGGLVPMGVGGLVGDPRQPLLSLGRSVPGPLYAITAGHRAVKKSDALTAPQVPSALRLSADRLVGMDSRASGTGPVSGRTAWQRPATSSAIGPEAIIGNDVTDVAASAARVATNGRSKLLFFDGGRLVQSTARVAALATLSGPYPLVSRSSADYVGVPLASLSRLPGTVEDNFGSRLLSLASGGRVLVVTDLADPGYRREVALPSDLGMNTVVSGARLWGDRIGVTFVTRTSTTDGFGVTCAWRVLDLSAAERGWSDARPGDLADLSDGLAVVRDQTGTGAGLSAWNLATWQEWKLADAARGSYPSVDGGRVAYATDSELVVREVPGTGTSSPRVLGVVADAGCNAWACAWSPQIDLTKGVEAGSLVIRDASGLVVRTLATPGAANGSIRGVAWDGKLDGGGFAPAGSYRWELSARAIDGSGAAVAVDGSSTAAGTIAVTRQSVGRIGLSVTIPDRAPVVGRTLRAAVRSTCADAALTYTWYAGSKVVSTGAGEAYASYLVRASDVGQRLRLVVDAVREGADPASRASARTRSVR